MLRKRDSEAKTILKKVVARTLEIITKNKEDESLGTLMSGKKNANFVDTPSIDFRMQTCRFLTELSCSRETVQIAEGVVGDDDENIEAWYLLAFALLRLKKHATAEECCANVRNLIIKLKVVDPDLEAGTMEIYQEILKHKAKT